MKIVEHLSDVAQGKTTIGNPRSPQWPAVRKKHLAEHPTCACCGGSEKLEVHHVLPFHLHPELELDPGNLVTLCESWRNGICCHLAVGHLGNYKAFNPSAIEDAEAIGRRIQARPLQE